MFKKRKARKRIIDEFNFDIKGYKLALVFVDGKKINDGDSELYNYGFTIEDTDEFLKKIPEEFDKVEFKSIRSYSNNNIYLIKLESQNKFKNLQIFYVFLKSKSRERTTEFDTADYMSKPIMGFHIGCLNNKVICESDIDNKFEGELSYDFISKTTYGNSHIVYEYDKHSVLSINCKYENRSTLDIFVFEKKLGGILIE